MSINVTSPITGSAQTGFTSPSWVVVPDTAPPGNPGEQVAVSSGTGTIAGVTFHSIASPFTINFTRAANLRVLGSPNPVTGVVSNVPKNSFTVVTRKGMLPLAGQPFQVGILRTEGQIPAGCDTTDPANVRALYSAHIGALNQQSAGMGDMAINGIL
ncbi:coat protein [ssRNA phage SRR5466725_4]|uniref:Coat protein n=1 Tax=ssRNA phage SRR5466725_4 TaxID=2786423 RepID=A0A8S5L5A5_9VIRU|nr:coat protein [ssRNA phage SRR5466725_4]DAD52402.1 TPA_asm: coat protein [ssRNA phage SRR5466725_4]